MSFNIDGLFLSNEARSWLRNQFPKRRHETVLIMNNLALAVEMKSYANEVVVRDTSIDFDHVSRNLNPQQWIETHTGLAQYGLTLYAENEPSPSPELMNWLYQVAQMCVARNWKVVLGNFSVGSLQPNELRWPETIRLFNYIAKYPKLLRLGLHEYFPALWTYELGRSTDMRTWDDIEIPDSRRFYLVGRYRNILDMGLTAIPKIIITEYGFDSLPSEEWWMEQNVPNYQRPAGYNNLLTAFNTWSQGRAAEYAYKSLMQGWEKIYQPFSEHILGVCFFCYGGQGVWTRFDISNSYLPQLFIDNGVPKRKEKKPVNNGTYLKEVKITNISAGRNVRTQPSLTGQVVKVYQEGDVAKVYIDSFAESGGYEWRRSTDGWFATAGNGLSVAQFTEVSDGSVPQYVIDSIRQQIAVLKTVTNDLEDLETRLTE